MWRQGNAHMVRYPPAMNTRAASSLVHARYKDPTMQVRCGPNTVLPPWKLLAVAVSLMLDQTSLLYSLDTGSTRSLNSELGYSGFCR